MMGKTIQNTMCIFVAGAVIAFSYIFFIIDFDYSIWQMLIDGEFQEYMELVFYWYGFDFWCENSALAVFLMIWAPLILYVAAGVLMYKRETSFYGMIAACTASGLFLFFDIIMFMISTDYAGAYVNTVGALVALFGAISLQNEYVKNELETDDIIVQAHEEETHTENLKGRIICAEGEYEGAEFVIDDQIIIGKDPAKCNLILSNKTISRVHCIISYDAAAGMYIIKDVSMNGTYLEDGQRIVKDVEVTVPSNTEIHIGNPKEVFILI